MLLFTLLLVASLFVLTRAEEENWGENGMDDWRNRPDREDCRDECRCPARQSLIFRSSAEPPYCQRIYFPGCDSIRCPEGYAGACFGSVATHKVSCPRRRPHKCPNGFWFVRGTQGKFNCVKVARPCDAERACRHDEYAVCIKVKPVNEGCRVRGFEERRLDGGEDEIDFE